MTIPLRKGKRLSKLLSPEIFSSSALLVTIDESGSQDMRLRRWKNSNQSEPVDSREHPRVYRVT